jgi:hypothetical protein
LERGVKNELGCTWIGANHEVHFFTVDIQDCPKRIEIHAELKKLSGKIKGTGVHSRYTFFAIWCRG